MLHQEKVQLIIDELDKDISGNRGLDNIKARLAFLGIHLTITTMFYARIYFF